MSLPLLEDLDADLAAVRSQRLPLLVLVSRADCPYCAEVRRNYLTPLMKENLVLIRELESEKHPDLVARLQVKFFPTVLLLDDHLNRLAEPLLGADHAGFYSAYLDRRIAEARRKLTSSTPR